MLSRRKDSGIRPGVSPDLYKDFEAWLYREWER